MGGGGAQGGADHGPLGSTDEDAVTAVDGVARGGCERCVFGRRVNWQSVKGVIGKGYFMPRSDGSARDVRPEDSVVGVWGGTVVSNVEEEADISVGGPDGCDQPLRHGWGALSALRWWVCCVCGAGSFPGDAGGGGRGGGGRGGGGMSGGVWVRELGVVRWVSPGVGG